MSSGIIYGTPLNMKVYYEIGRDPRSMGKRL